MSESKPNPGTLTDYSSLIETLKATKALVQFELEHRSEALSPEQKTVWDQLLTKVVEELAVDCMRLETLGIGNDDAVIVYAMSYETIQHLLRERIQKISSMDTLSVWSDADDRLRTFVISRKVVDEETAFLSVEQAANDLENLLQMTEYLLQTPKRWNYKWDQRENLDLKISYLSNELRTYKSRTERDLKALSEVKLGKAPNYWPKNREAIMVLYHLSLILKPVGIASIVIDPTASIGLIIDEAQGSLLSKAHIGGGEKSLGELKTRNDELKQALNEARRLAESGNFERAAAYLTKVPSTYRVQDQKTIQDYINRYKQRINYLQALYEKALKGDLQKLQWRDIEKACVVERAQINNYGDNASDYERAADEILTPLERLIKSHFRTSIAKNAVIALFFCIGIAVVVFGFMQIQRAEGIFPVKITVDSSETRWQVFDINGNPVGNADTGNGNLQVDRGNYWVRFQRGKKIALQRLQAGLGGRLEISEEEAFRNPFVRLQLFDPSKLSSVNPSDQEIRIDGVPVDSDIEGCYLPKGMRRFTLKQKGEPDYDVSMLIQNKSEEVALISPWEVVSLNAEALDLSGAINNGNRRKLPSKLYLPVGIHFLVVTDSRGDIRSSRQIEVARGATNEFYVGVPHGLLKVTTQPILPNIQVWINGINYGTTPKEVPLSAGDVKIQLIRQGRIMGESPATITPNEVVERVFRLQ